MTSTLLLGAYQEVDDGDVNKLDKVANKSHYSKSSCRHHGYHHEFLPIRPVAALDKAKRVFRELLNVVGCVCDDVGWIHYKNRANVTRETHYGIQIDLK